MGYQTARRTDIAKEIALEWRQILPVLPPACGTRDNSIFFTTKCFPPIY